MSVFGLGRAITLYGDLERVAIRPVHLPPEARRAPADNWKNMFKTGR